jgi:hypothetical protein
VFVIIALPDRNARCIPHLINFSGRNGFECANQSANGFRFAPASNVVGGVMLLVDAGWVASLVDMGCVALLVVGAVRESPLRGASVTTKIPYR